MSINLPVDLMNPTAFPHPAAHVECIETHISWVFLAGDYAYKIKKPVDLGFLDFSTLARRRAACEEELRINRRTAPMLYEAVVGIAESPARIQSSSASEAVEYAVRMRRFSQESLLSALLPSHADMPALVDRLAWHVADFHAGAGVAAADGEYGRADAVYRLVQQNFGMLRERIDAVDMQGLLETVQQWSASAFTSLHDVFAARLAAGWVRECHGDLHLGNIVVLEGQPLLFDAIEFNPALRWIDVMADVAFLVMDLQARGRTDLGWRFLNAWLEKTGDYAGLRLLPFYLSYRAMVRAKVAAIRVEQLQGAAREAAVAECRRYLELAASYAVPARTALVITHGISGSGKTTHSQHLMDAYGLIRVRADVERKRLYGLTSTQSSAGVPGGIYSAQANQRVQDRLEVLARQVLQAGFPVLVDATHIRRAPRERMYRLAKAMRVPCLVLAFAATPAVLRARAAQRTRQGQDASEADATVVDKQLVACEALEGRERAVALTIDTGWEVDWKAVLPQFAALWARVENET